MRYSAAFAFTLATVATAAVQDRAEIALKEGLARKVYISATKDDGAAATDLAPADLTVRLDGRDREVLKVAPADDVMQVVLLVDDSGGGIQHIREAVADFMQILKGHEIALISTGKQNTVMVDFTTDYGALVNGVRRLVTRTTSGGYLLDAIEESARALVRREATRPVIVIVSLEGTEFSSVSADRVLDAVRQSNAVVFALSIGKPGLKTMVPWSSRPTDSIHQSLDETVTRAEVLAEAPRRSGGRHEQVVEVTGVPKRLAGVAYELRDQLVVTYARPQDHRGQGRLDVSVKRRGIKLRAPKTVS